MYRQIPGATSLGGSFAGYYTLPCSSRPNISFTFGGVAYRIADEDFFLGTYSAATADRPAFCLGAFFDLTLSTRSAAVIQWVIGCVPLGIVSQR